MPIRDTMEYATVTKAEIIKQITNDLMNSEKEDFARDVSRFLHTTVEPTDDDNVFEYWQRVYESPNLYWQEINDDVFVIREKYVESISRRLRTRERSVTIDLAAYNEETIEKCLNERGYTLRESDADYYNMEEEYDEDARAMIAVFLSGKLPLTLPLR